MHTAGCAHPYTPTPVLDLGLARQRGGAEGEKGRRQAIPVLGEVALEVVVEVEVVVVEVVVVVVDLQIQRQNYSHSL